MRTLLKTPLEPIAIIGIGCRFPGANGPEAFWRLLVQGVDAIREVPPDRWDAGSFHDAAAVLPGRANTRRGGFVDLPSGAFDARFFGIPPREAALVDPMQAWLLEVTWEALEDAGILPERLAGSQTGVFMGISAEDGKTFQLRESNRELLGQYTETGTAMTMAANRLSYWFDLRGPSISLDTACSSSLVAIHLACESLWSGAATLALAGGANVMFQPELTIAKSKAGMLSPEGRCNAFDARANGYVRSEGAGVVVLKPLAAAVADGDDIYALIRGTATNQDGRTPGITVPRGEAQRALAREALGRAGLSPSAVQYVEAHGAGTLVGDSIEARALGEVFGQERAEGERCLVGSVKTNIGHLEAAAGVAGLIKAALCLKHRQIPPTLHLKTPNPQIDFDALRLRVPVKLEPWPKTSHPALAAVNSFGFGGTNASAVLSEAPAAATPPESPAAVESSGPALVALSARSEESLRRLAATYQTLAARQDEGASGTPPLRDLACAAARRRSHHPHRLSAVAGSYRELADSLAEWLEGRMPSGLAHGQVAPRAQGGMAFVYSGVGPQWWGMGRTLMATEPVFRQAVERCDEMFRRWSDWSLLEELSKDEAHSRMRESETSQRANFALQMGLTELLRSWGFAPDGVVGHSTGEVCSTWAAGVLSFEQACELVFKRSPLEHRMAGQGKLLAVGMSYEKALALIADSKEIGIAAVNSPISVTLAGEHEAIEQLCASLTKQGVLSRILKVEGPFHTHFMEPLHDEVMSALSGMRPRAAQLPIYSTILGKRAHGSEMDVSYWWRSVRNTVRFADAIENLLADGFRTFVELSPHPVLTGSISECAELRGFAVRTVPTLRRKSDERSSLLETAGALYASGLMPEWTTLFPGPARPVKPPTYAWNRQVYWLESAESRNDRLGPLTHPLLGRRQVAPQPTWQGQVARHAPAYIEDHAVQGTVVIPSTAYLEMGVAALRQATGAATGAVELSDVRFRSALFLREGGATLRTTLDLDGPRFSVHGRTSATEEKWELHASGNLRRIPARTAAPGRLAALQATFRTAKAHDATACYARLRKLQLEHGPRFQGLRKLLTLGQESLASIDFDPAFAGQMAGHEIPPPLLDACFHAFIAGTSLPDDSREMYGLVSIERMAVFAPLSGRLWAHVRLDAGGRRLMTGTLDIYADDGRLLVSIEGIRIQAFDASDNPQALPRLFYEATWSEVKQEPVQERLEAGACWLLLADAKGVATALAAGIQAAGGDVVLVRPGAQFSASPDRRHFQVNLDQVEDFGRLLAALENGLRPGRIIHLWGLDSPETEALTTGGLMDAQGPGVVALLHLLQALEKANWNQSPRLWVLTRGARSVVGDARPPAVAQSPLWGFATTLFQQEHPELAGGIVDLDPAAPAGEVERLLALLSAPLPDPQLAFRQGRLWSHRMVPAPHLAGGKLPPRLRADATYLIAGGRGGLGLVLARSLIQRGARRLILAGRTALPPRRDWARVDPGSATGRQISAIREMEALGASIHPEALDVSDEGQVREFLEAFRGEGWPPIRGVIHAAGVMSSARLSELGASGLRATLAPKLAGAWNLHRLLAGEPLDFFVLCSSVSSLGFSKGVPDDAAGNAFLDGLAHARRHLGLHGLSVNWSPWGEVGMASQEQVARDFESRGYTPLRPAQGVEALDRCLEHDVRQAAILGVDWPRLLRANFPAPPPPLLQSMVEQVAATAPAEGTRGQEQENLRVRLAKVEDLAARRQLVEDFLRVTLARALKLAPEMLDHERPFQEFGLDSVMAVELRLRIIGDLGVGPNLVELLQESSVAALAERLLPQIQLTTNDESLVLDDLAAQLEALSDEERDALLASLNS